MAKCPEGCECGRHRPRTAEEIEHLRASIAKHSTPEGRRKGGTTRQAQLTPEERSELGRKAFAARDVTPERSREISRRGGLAALAKHGNPLARYSPEERSAIARKGAIARLAVGTTAAGLERLEKKYDVCYADELATQGGGCALCGTPPNGKPLLFDHDHRTGAFRGLLCHGCNTALGRLGDNELGLERALAYLRKKR